jgi:phosphoglycolate phosphatase
MPAATLLPFDRPVAAVLCDLDGTLVDSAPDIRSALNTAFAQDSLAPFSLDEIKSMVGDGSARLVARALAARSADPARAAGLLARYSDLYTANVAATTQPYPGVRETLQALKARGRKLAVVTNKPSAATAALLAQLGLRDLFDAVIGGDSAAARKPDPAPVIAALSLLEVAPSDAVMVGDNHHDITAARAAGVRCIAVTYGYSHRPPADLGADRLVASFADILQLA